MTTTTSITSRQLKQYKRFVEDAAEKALADAGLDKDRIQRLIGNGGEFQADILASINRLSLTDQYADEEVASSYGYLSGYAPKPIAEQVNRLRELFPELGSVDETIATQPLPPHAEGHFVIPRWEKIAKTYGEAVEKVLALIENTRNGKFQNYRKGQLGADRLRESVRKVNAIKALTDQQKGHNVLIVPGQLGLRHRGRSVRCAHEVFVTSEFGFGAYETGIILLTHPERLQHLDDLWIDCAGDEYAPFAVGRFSGAPYFRFRGGEVKFGTHAVDDPSEFYGSASAVPPQ